MSEFRGLLVASLTTLVLAAAAAPAPAAAPAGFWGVNANYVVGKPNTFEHFAAMKAAGIDWIRVAAGWAWMEPKAPVNGVHSYQWGEFDVILRVATAAGLEVRPMVGFSPPWASTDGTRYAKPKDPADFATFVRAFAERYGPYGDVWQSPRFSRRVRGANPVTTIEIWNEQNQSAFWHQPDPVAYAELLVKAIDAVNARTPVVNFVSGGLVPGAGNATKIEAGSFLAQMVAAQPSLTAKLGEVGVHSYSNATYDVMDLVQKVRNGADAAGLTAQPLAFNENGWTTVPGNPGYFLTPVDEPLRGAKLSNMVGRVHQQRVSMNLSSYAVYTWASPEADPTDGEQWFGIADMATATLKPSGQALADAIAYVDSQP